MTYLSLVLTAKIAVSIAMLAIPFLLLPKEKLGKVMGLEAKSSTLFRLYGVAILALLTAYSYGIYSAQSGEFPWGIILMGIVSNIGGSAALILTGSAGRQLFSTIFFAIIGICLTLSALAPAIALTRIL